MPYTEFQLTQDYFSYIFIKYADLSELNNQKELDSEYQTYIKEINQNYAALQYRFVLKSSNLIVSSIYQICEEFNEKLRKRKFQLVLELQKLIDLAKMQKLSDQLTSLLKFFLDFFWHFKYYVRRQTPDLCDWFLNRIKDSIKPNGSLTKNMFDIFKQKFEHPVNFLQFRILYCAFQCFVATLFFTLEQHALMADYYFQQGDILKFNSCLQSLALCFKDYQDRLWGNSEQRKNGLIKKLKQRATELLQLPRQQTEEADFNLLSESIAMLEEYEQMLQKIKLPFVTEQPVQLKFKPDFKYTALQVPIGAWQMGQKVSYTVQHENNGVYTKLAPLSAPFSIKKHANPRVYIPTAPKHCKRLVYRKFANSKSIELVGILYDEQQTSLQDLSRDLYNAAKNQNEELALQEFKVYLKNGADIRAVFENGSTVWHAAAAAGNVKIAKKFLLGNKLLDINAADANNKTVLDVAAEHGHRKFCELLKENDAILSYNKKHEFHAAAYENHALKLELLLENESLDPNESDEFGFTTIHYAVVGGKASVEVLLKSPKVNVNKKSVAGLTALHLAVFRCENKIASLLTESGADINATSKMGLTALHFAAMLNDFEMTELLLSGKNIDVNAAASNGWTALHLAIYRHRRNTVNALLRVSNINVNAKLAQSLTPLHMAVIMEYVTLVEILLENGAEINAQTRDGLTPLHMAAKLNCTQLVAKLLEHHANVTLKTVDGLTALLMAVNCKTRQDSEVLRLLIDSGADINATNQEGLTFEWLAAQKGTYDIMKYIDRRYKVSRLVDRNGNNLLHHAAEAGNVDTATYFLKHKIFDMNTVNNIKVSALDLALKNGDKELIQLFFNHQAET